MSKRNKMICIVMPIFILVSGCKQTVKSDDKVGKVVTLGVTNGNENEQLALNKVLENIEDKYGLVIEKKIYTDHATQLKAELAGGVAPDVFYVDSVMAPELIEAKMLGEIPQKIKDEADINDFYSNLVSAFSDGTKVYGFPKDFSALAIFYNEKLLNDAGYEVSDIPKNFEDWYDFLHKLQGKLPTGVTALSSNQDLARYMSLMQSSGNKVYKQDGTSNLSEPKILEAVDYIASFYSSGVAKTPTELGNDWVGDTFGLENTVLALEGNWMIGHLANNFPDVKYGTSAMPTYFESDNTLSFTVAYAVNANSKNIEEANLLAMYLTDVENMTTWCGDAQILPARESVANILKLENNPIQGELIKSAAYSTPWQAGITLPVILREFNNWFPRVASGEMTAEEAMLKADLSANTDIINMIDR
jgi:multiple sugar transport system substrate-binding protein